MHIFLENDMFSQCFLIYLLCQPFSYVCIIYIYGCFLLHNLNFKFCTLSFCSQKKKKLASLIFVLNKESVLGCIYLNYLFCFLIYYLLCCALLFFSIFPYVCVIVLLINSLNVNLFIFI